MSVWTGTVEWNGGMDWTGMEWNGMAGCNFVIKFCGRDQTLTRVHTGNLGNLAK